MRSRLAAVPGQYPHYVVMLTSTCCLQGATDIPSWQQRMQSTAGRLQDGLKLSTVLNCFSPKPVKEARYDGPFCTAAEFNALFRMAWTTSKAVRSLSRVLPTSEAQHLHV